MTHHDKPQIGAALVERLSRNGPATRLFDGIEKDPVFSGQSSHWTEVSARNAVIMEALKRPDDISTLSVMFKVSRRRDKENPDDEAHNPFQACSMGYTYSKSNMEWTAYVWIAYDSFPRGQVLRALISDLVANFHEHCLKEDAKKNAGDGMHGICSSRIVLLDAGIADADQMSIVSRELDFMAYVRNTNYDSVYTRRLHVAGLEVAVYGIPVSAGDRGVLVSSIASTPVLAVYQEDATKGFQPMVNTCEQSMCSGGKTRVLVALDPMSVASLSLSSVYHTASLAVKDCVPLLCRLLLEDIVLQSTTVRPQDVERFKPHVARGPGTPKPYVFDVMFEGAGSCVRRVRMLLLVKPPGSSVRDVDNTHPLLTVHLTCADIAPQTVGTASRYTLEALVEASLGLKRGSMRIPSDDTEAYVTCERPVKLSQDEATLGGESYDSDLRMAKDPATCGVHRFLRYAVARHLVDHSPIGVAERGIGTAWHSAMFHWGCRVSQVGADLVQNEWRTTEELLSMGIHVPDVSKEDPEYWVSAYIKPGSVIMSAGTQGGPDGKLKPAVESSAVAFGYDSDGRAFTCTHVRVPATSIHPVHGIRAHIPAHTYFHALNTQGDGVLRDVCDALSLLMFVPYLVYDGNTNMAKDRHDWKKRTWAKKQGQGRAPKNTPSSPVHETGLFIPGDSRQYFYPWTHIKISLDPIDLRAGARFLSISTDKSGESSLTLHPFVLNTAVNRTKKLAVSKLHGGDAVKYLDFHGLVVCVLWGLAHSMLSHGSELEYASVLSVMRSLCEHWAKTVEGSRRGVEENNAKSLTQTLRQKNVWNLVASTQLGKKVRFVEWVNSVRRGHMPVPFNEQLVSMDTTSLEEIDKKTILDFYGMYKRASESMGFWPKEAVRVFMERNLNAREAMRRAEMRGWKDNLEYALNAWGVRVVDNPEREWKKGLELLKGRASSVPEGMNTTCAIGDDIKELANFTPEMLAVLCMDFASCPFYGPNDYVITAE